jgi:hypothetical protein
MKKSVFFVVLAMVLISSCAVQSENDAQKIVGTWVSEIHNVVFNANGTGIWNGENISFGISTGGSIILLGSSRFPVPIETTLYISPDGRKIIFFGANDYYILQKK